MVRLPRELPDNFCRHMSKKTLFRCCLLGIQYYIAGLTVPLTGRRNCWSVAWASLIPVHACTSCVFACDFARLLPQGWRRGLFQWTLIPIAPSSWSCRRCVRQARQNGPSQPSLQCNAMQWAPPPAMGLTPGLRSPTALCYAGANVCPLTQPEHIGEPCTCGTGGPLL